MVQGIFIPADTWLPAVFDEYDGLASYQDAVDGYIEPISIADPPLTLYVNEEGKLRGLPTNPRATLLWWLLVPEARGMDMVVGHAVVVPDGASAAATQLLELLDSEVAMFRVETRPSDASSEWAPASDRHFNNWFEAARYALMVQQPGGTFSVRVEPL
jgi:Domain of unknown function (DUF3846)